MTRHGRIKTFTHFTRLAIARSSFCAKVTRTQINPTTLGPSRVLEDYSHAFKSMDTRGRIDRASACVQLFPVDE
jgi:hypothetical protein